MNDKQSINQGPRDLFAGLTKNKVKFEKSDSEIVTLKRCEVKETNKGTAMVCLEIEGKNIDPLFITPMRGVGHNVGGEKKFWKNEATNHISRITKIGEIEVDVPKDEVINILNGLDFGTQISVEMDNGFIVSDGKVCDVNRTRRYQFLKIVEAIGGKLGLTVGMVETPEGVHNAILRQGREITSQEFNQLFRERGIGATIQCRFSKNNLTGKTSLFDIQIPENQRRL